MSVIGDILGAIETILTANLFVVTEDVFDFDAVPDSIIDKAYRIETKQDRAEYQMNHKVEARETMTVYIAYRQNRLARTTMKTARGAGETIEKAIINAATLQALASSPIIQMDGEAATVKELKDYLVLRLQFSIDYMRDVTP